MVKISNEYQVIAHHIGGTQISTYPTSELKKLNAWVKHLVKYGIDFEVKFCTLIDGVDVNHKECV